MFRRHRSRGHHRAWRAEETTPEYEEACDNVYRARRHRWFGGRHGHGPAWRGRGPFPHQRPFGFGPKGGPPFGPPFGGRGPFGGDPFDDDGGGRRRHRRGDLKYVLLELLAEQPRHGYELIKVLEQRYAGFYRPSPGSVYPTLQLLEDEGSVTSESVEGKRVYTITEAGRHLVEEHRQRAQRPGGRRGEGRGGPNLELDALRHSAMALLSSIMQVARHGTPEQQRAALERLDNARREIYRILAQDDSDRLV